MKTVAGKTGITCSDHVIEAEKRSLSLFSTERLEDYMAILVAAVVLTIVLLFVPG